MTECCTASHHGSSGIRFAFWLTFSLALAGCAGANASSRDRYPEEKHPEAPRSASDDEVLGAHEQDPADTLEGSLTNEHPAPRSPHAERPNEAARERLDAEECIEASSQPPTAADGTPRRRPVCPPLSEVERRD